jgi:hypothetical protein
MKYIRNAKLYEEDGTPLPGDIHDWFKILEFEQATNYDKDPVVTEPAKKRNLDDCSGMYDPWIFSTRSPVNILPIDKLEFIDTYITPYAPLTSLQRSILCDKD